MKLHALAATAALLAAGPAVASAQTPAPLTLDTVDIQPSYGVYNNFQSGLVTVAFTNERAVVATDVDFQLEANGRLIGTFHDSGSFAPGVVIKHSFPTSATDLNEHLAVSTVTYADGTVWNGDDAAPRSLRQADVSLLK